MHTSETERYKEQLFIRQEELANRIPKHGDVVVYHDEVGEPYNALITSGAFEHGGYAQGWINVLYVSKDETKKDPYGRQIERSSSVSHVTGTTAWGRYWRWPDEKPNERP